MPIKDQHKKCINCNHIFNDMTINRCPKCSSNKLEIVINIEDIVDLSDSMKGKVKDPNFSSKRNPRVEFITGTDMWYDENKLVHKEQLIDKTQNLYKKKIIDKETGEVIMDIEEPLTQHQGHGSAKLRRKK